MANQNVYIVKKGDTLSEIAASNGIGSTAMKGAEILARINGIANMDYITVGQKIYLYGADVDHVKAADVKRKMVSWKTFGKLIDRSGVSTKTVYVAWAWKNPSGSKTACFEVQWEWWAPGMIKPEIGVNTTIELYDRDDGSAKHPPYHSLYSGYPDNATKVRAVVLPKVFKKVSGSIDEDEYDSKNLVLCGKNTTEWYNFDNDPPVAPSAPDIDEDKLDKLKLTASLSDLDPLWESQAVQIEFQLTRNNSTVVSTISSGIKTGYASASWEAPKITTGSEYKVRCRAVREDDEDTVNSPWSEYSQSVYTKPGGAPKITKCQASKAADGSNGICVYLEWTAISTAESYTIEYSTNPDDLIYNRAQSDTVEGSTKYKTQILEDGGTYYFRVRASNKHGDTEWSNGNDPNKLTSITIGEIPAAPTTWSSQTSVIAGNPVTLYWIHNARDNSDETFADLKIYINGVEQLLEPIENTDKGEETDGISSYIFQTDGTEDGKELRWKVRTAGVTQEFGDWSEERIINIYATPTLDLTITDPRGDVISGDKNVTSFPLYVRALASPPSQVPIGYHVSIVSNQVYETTDGTGSVKTVNDGEEIYSKFFDISEPLLAELSASNVDFADGCSYTLNCTVTMDSGLDAEASTTFRVSWNDEERWPNADVNIDTETLVAYIRPFCEGFRTVYKEVVTNTVGGVTTYVLTDYDVEIPSDPRLISDTLEQTTTGEYVFSFVNADTGATVLFCKFTNINEYTDVRLAVYRREFDGTFTELATDINPARNTHVTDPHPALDYARYRIVATQQGTGAVSYNDIPAVSVGEKAVVIQWDADWTEFETSDPSITERPPWSGSMLKLPYNIDVSDSYGTDNSLVKYIGRKYPVSYYGTQLDSSSTWNVEIPKTDKDTLYALRRLAIWTGDVYVREPSGTGYWANISVSFSQKHCETTIPVTFNIKRVEGGV